MHGRWLFYAGEEKFLDAERMLQEACDIFYALNRSGDNEAVASGSTSALQSHAISIGAILINVCSSVELQCSHFPA